MRLPLLAALLLSGMSMSAPGAELYGRPLRGLSPVPIAELQRKASEFDGKTVRVKGEVRAEKGAFRLADGDATLRVTMREADSALPSDANGATATAEGVFRAKGPGGAPGLEATGLELTRGATGPSDPHPGDPPGSSFRKPVNSAQRCGSASISGRPTRW